MHNFGLVEEDLITFKISVLVTWTKTMRSIYCCKLITHSPVWKRTRHKLTQIVQTAGLVAILKVLIFPEELWVVHIFSEDHFRFLQPKISGNAQSSTVVPAKMAVESAAQVSIVLFKVLSFSSMLYHSRLVMYKTLGGIFLIQPYTPSLFCCFLQFEPIATLSLVWWKTFKETGIRF